jgi:hypothetical protein
MLLLGDRNSVRREAAAELRGQVGSCRAIVHAATEKAVRIFVLAREDVLPNRVWSRLMGSIVVTCEVPHNKRGPHKFSRPLPALRVAAAQAGHTAVHHHYSGG